MNPTGRYRPHAATSSGRQGLPDRRSRRRQPEEGQRRSVAADPRYGRRQSPVQRSRTSPLRDPSLCAYALASEVNAAFMIAMTPGRIADAVGLALVLAEMTSMSPKPLTVSTRRQDWCAELSTQFSTPWPPDQSGLGVGELPPSKPPGH